MQTKDWATLVIAVLTLLAGSGWGKYLLERRQERRESARVIVQGFLMPLQAILKQNKRVHDALTKDQDFQNLEYAPDYLQGHFQSLPDTDSRKLAWKTLIEGLLEDNQRAVTLVQDNYGRILRDDFRSACDDFVEHAREWDAVWRATLGAAPVPVSMHGRDRLLSRAFPEAMDSLLALEIEQRRREAGM